MACHDTSVRRDQNVSRKTEGASVWAAFGFVLDRIGFEDRSPDFRAQDRPDRRFHAELFVELLLRVADDMERKVPLIWEKSVFTGVKHNHFSDPVRLEL